MLLLQVDQYAVVNEARRAPAFSDFFRLPLPRDTPPIDVQTTIISFLASKDPASLEQIQLVEFHYFRSGQ